MRFAVAAAGLVAVASASLEGYGMPEGYGPSKNMTSAAPVPASYTTEVMTEYTTYCPGPTSVTHNGVTYTVTEATTLTITNCPCTVTKPVYSTTPAAPTYPASSPAAPTYPASSPMSPVPIPYPSPKGNGTTPAAPTYPATTGTGAYTPPASTSPIAPGYTGAASKASFGVAGLLAAAGLVAAL